VSGEHVYDVAIIGGGIHGTGVARDATGRGLSVLLCEQGDLAGGTSWASSKLIHGGLRYLEQGEFALVAQALQERHTLMQIAPHLVTPLPFVFPIPEGQYSSWKLWAGMKYYDWLARKDALPSSQAFKLATSPEGDALAQPPPHAYRYYDCQTKDARLVIANAQDAEIHGAVIRTHTKVMRASREEKDWQLTLQDCRTGKTDNLRAKTVVNAGGPWAMQLMDGVIDSFRRRGTLRLIKGSHIVLPKLYTHDTAYTLPLEDGRIIFTIPFEKDYTLIGTTEEDYKGDPGAAAISMSEAMYLCQAVEQYFGVHVTPIDTVWSFAGVRPIYDIMGKSMHEASRDYEVKVEKSRNMPPLVNILGGKLTTYRRVAEEVTDRLCELLQKEGDTWTATHPLPGGEMRGMAYERYTQRLRIEYDWLPHELLTHYLSHYGDRTEVILDGVRHIEGLGQHFGGMLYEAEVDYLRFQEWANTPEDILWRRTKQGLHLSAAQQQKLAVWMGTELSVEQLLLSHHDQDALQ